MRSIPYGRGKDDLGDSFVSETAGYQSPMGKVKYISRKDIMETYQSPTGKVKVSCKKGRYVSSIVYQSPMGKVKPAKTVIIVVTLSINLLWER